MYHQSITSYHNLASAGYVYKMLNFCDLYDAKPVAVIHDDLLAKKKENSKMANKTFNIRNHGLATDNIFTIRYTLESGFNPCWNDLVNLNQEEMIALRDQLDNQIMSKGGDIDSFMSDLKKLARRYNVSGSINTFEMDVDGDDYDRGSVTNPTNLRIGGKDIKTLNIGYYDVRATYTEEKSVSA